MPFKSEKQRRFLWASHPDIAKRWAHEYPKSNKGLPMYAHKKQDEKAAALTAIHSYVNKLNNSLILPHTVQNKAFSKIANSKQTYIEIPHSEKPTYAGEEREKNPEHRPDFDVTQSGTNQPKKRQENAINALLKKVALVVGPNIKKMKEQQDAALEGREPVYVPSNENVKRYPVATPGIMPPMGSQPQAPQQAPAKQPQSRPSAPAVGNGSTPQSRPIQSFGGLDVNNKLTGNSGLAGGRNPGAGLKTSSVGFGAQQQMPQQDSNSPGIAQRIGNAINTVDQGTGLGWGTIGGVTTMPAGLAAQGYLKAVNPYIENTIDTPEWQKLMQYIETNHPELDVTTTQKIRHHGRSTLKGMSRELSANAPTRGGFKNWLMNLGLNNQKKTVEAIGKQPGFYHPGREGIIDPSIAYNTRFKTPGILAHELGHHTGGKLMTRANQFGRMASGIGTLGALTATDENTSRNRAMAGSASFLPTLISEFDASRRGAKIMKNLKLPGRMKAFVGLPTYAMMAGAPMLAHYGKKYLGGFTPNKQQP